MKKIGIVILCCFLFLVVAFNSVKVSLKADVEINQNLFDGFVCEKVRECYYCIEIDGEYEISRSILLYTGTYNNDEAYILYSTETNQVIEYSLNSSHPWTDMRGSIYIVVYSVQSIYYTSLYKFPTDDRIDYCFYYDSNEYIIDNDLGPIFQETLEYDTNVLNFNYSENIIKQNSISNSFYFENLNVNYGDNNNHTCSQLAISMYLAYVNEFLDNSILPDTLELTENVDGNLNTYSITKDSYYNKVYENNYDITSFETPGANDLLHQFIIKYGQNLYSNDSSIRSLDKAVDLTSNYLEQFYDNNNVNIRLVSDFRYINQSMKDEVNQLFPNSYEYYESITDRELLKKVIDENSNEVEYEFDIFTEIDNGNPVVLSFTDEKYWELNFEGYDNESISGVTLLPSGHVAVVYGYVLTDNGLYYRCHFGHKVNNENYNNNDVWVRSSVLNGSDVKPIRGFVIKKFNETHTNEESSYYYDNDGCIMNLPTNEVFETYEEFAVSTGNIEYDNLKEYYYCDCDVPHLLHQKEHTFKFHEFDNTKHIKYCSCGYSINEEHSLYHHTFIDGHYEICNICSYSNAHPDGVIYEVVYEMEHSWICSSCNTSGTNTHTFEFESAGLHSHYSSCTICDYENIVPHGFEFDIWYTRIDDATHLAHCSCCEEEWIENHTTYCPCY